MIEIFARGKGERAYTLIPNGPWPVTREQLDEARARFQAEQASCPPLEGVNMAPATTARTILAEIAPHLSAFDCAILAYAVTIKSIRVE